MTTFKEKSEQYVRGQLPELTVRMPFGMSDRIAEIQLQHWLRVLEDEASGNLELNQWRKQIQVVAYKKSDRHDIYFNLTTGQPATEADYQAFCNIVGV